MRQRQESMGKEGERKEWKGKKRGEENGESNPIQTLSIVLGPFYQKLKTVFNCSRHQRLVTVAFMRCM